MKRVNMPRLMADLDTVRMSRGLSWRAVVRETGINSSQPTQWGSYGTSMSADSFVTMLAWANLPADRYVEEASDASEMRRALIESYGRETSGPATKLDFFDQEDP